MRVFGNPGFAALTLGYIRRAPLAREERRQESPRGSHKVDFFDQIEVLKARRAGRQSALKARFQ